MKVHIADSEVIEVLKNSPNHLAAVKHIAEKLRCSEYEVRKFFEIACQISPRMFIGITGKGQFLLGCREYSELEKDELMLMLRYWMQGHKQVYRFQLWDEPQDDEEFYTEEFKQFLTQTSVDVKLEILSIIKVLQDEYDYEPE